MDRQHLRACLFDHFRVLDGPRLILEDPNFGRDGNRQRRMQRTDEGGDCLPVVLQVCTVLASPRDILRTAEVEVKGLVALGDCWLMGQNLLRRLQPLFGVVGAKLRKGRPLFMLLYLVRRQEVGRHHRLLCLVRKDTRMDHLPLLPLEVNTMYTMYTESHQPHGRLRGGEERKDSYRRIAEVGAVPSRQDSPREMALIDHWGQYRSW